MVRKEHCVPSLSLIKSCNHSARSAPSFRPKKETVTWIEVLTGNSGEGIGMALITAPSVARRRLKSSSESKTPNGGLASRHESQSTQSLPTLWGHID